MHRSPLLFLDYRPHAIFLIKGNSYKWPEHYCFCSFAGYSGFRYLVTHFGIDLVFDGCCSPHDADNLSPNPKRDSFIARENLLYDLSCSSSSAVSSHSLSIIGSPISHKIEAYERSLFVICFANSAVFLPYALQKLIVDFKPPDEYKAMFSSSANRAKDFNNELWCLVEIDYSMPPSDIINNICSKLDFLLNDRRKFISSHCFSSCSYSL